jgi:two-component system, OmpR family, copper resistance phosphate regulon response regulator CusR
MKALDLNMTFLSVLGLLHSMRCSEANLRIAPGLFAGEQFPELLARVRTLLRRNQTAPVDLVVRVMDLEIDPVRHRATRSGRRIDLSAKEFALLTLLARRAGQVLSRTQIASLVWDIHFDSDTNVVEVAIRRLRAKVDDPFPDRLIHTVRGVGYVLERRS